MKIQWKTLILCIAIPLAVGGLSALFTADSMQSFQVQPQPPLSPPGWLFPIVWTIHPNGYYILLYRRIRPAKAGCSFYLRPPVICKLFLVYLVFQYEIIFSRISLAYLFMDFDF